MSHRRNIFRIQLACACLAFSSLSANAQDVELVPAPASAAHVEQPQVLRPAFDFQPKWVWSNKSTDTNVIIEQSFYLDTLPSEAELQITVDNAYSSLKLNAKDLGSGNDWTKPKSIPILADLQQGFNKFSIAAKNVEGEAGALVVIRLKYGQQILLVGTGESTTVLIPGPDLQLATTKPPTAGPWNLVKPEAERTAYARGEAKRFLEQLQNSDVHIASRSLGILAQFALDFTSLELNGPTVSLGSPNVKPYTLSTEVYNQVAAHLSDPQKIKQQAASAAVTLLTSKAVNLTPLFNVLKPIYCAPGQANLDAQLAILSGIRQRLDADGTAYTKLNDDFRKAADAKQAEVGDAKSKVEAKEIEVAEAGKQLNKTLDAQVQNNLQLDILKNEITQLDVRINDPNNIGIKAQLVKERAEKAAMQKTLENKATSLASLAASQLGKRIQLDEDLAELKNAAIILVQELGSLVAPAPTADMLARLKAIEEFLRAAANCNSQYCVDQYGQAKVFGKLGIVGSLELQLIEDARALHYRYASIKTLDQAAAFFALTTGTGGVPNPDLGAATSAADLPTAADAFTSADRASVSSTAPYNAANRPQTPPQYPLTDYRGQRLQRDISKDEQNVVRKAPGAKPAEKAKAATAPTPGTTSP